MSDYYWGENNRFITNSVGSVCMACCEGDHYACHHERPAVCSCKSTEPHAAALEKETDT